KVAAFKLQAGEADLARNMQEEVLGIWRKFAARDPQNKLMQAGVAAALTTLSKTLHAIGDEKLKAGNLDAARAAYHQSLDLRREVVASGRADADDISAIGGLAYQLLFVRDFAAALEAADLAISQAPKLYWIHGNRAHALMFLDRVTEAEAVYMQYRGEQNVVGEKSWEKSVIDDFAELRGAGLTHPLMEKIE